MKNFFLFIWETVKIFVIAAVIVVPIRYFLFQPFIVRGESMEPNFHTGDYLIIDEISYRIRDPQRGEVIVFKYPNNPVHRYIKRVIGLPGESVEIKEGKISITKAGSTKILDESAYFAEQVLTSGNYTFSLGENEYLVLGDNRAASSDSRAWGLLPEKYIIGRAFFRAWPVSVLAKIPTPFYQAQ